MIDNIMALIAQEGDEREFDYQGYHCLIKRHPNLLHLCGYIEIPEGHPLYELDYDAIEERYNYELPSHGGLTFAGHLDYTGYLIGFDCAHLGDYLPSSITRFGDEVYRTMDYVEVVLKHMVYFIKKKEDE